MQIPEQYAETYETALALARSHGLKEPRAKKLASDFIWTIHLNSGGEIVRHDVVYELINKNKFKVKIRRDRDAADSIGVITDFLERQKENPKQWEITAGVALNAAYNTFVVTRTVKVADKPVKQRGAKVDTRKARSIQQQFDTLDSGEQQQLIAKLMQQHRG